MSDKNIIIGLGFGDEGKGRVVDWLSSTISPDLVVRFSGGHQAAHTVMLNEHTSHIFSSFGSGTLRHVPTYISYFCTVDPVGLLNEHDALKSKNPNPLLLIDAKCPIVTPLDKEYNVTRNIRLNHGTCGVGFGTTLQREEDRYSLLFEDLFSPAVLSIKLDMIGRYYTHKTSQNYTTSLKWEREKANFIEDCNELINLGVGIVKDHHRKTLLSGKCIYEGSQGLLLDQDIGFFPHVTRSKIDLTNIVGLNNSFNDIDGIDDLWLVTRAYQTRHGTGPMTNEDYLIPDNPHETNHDHGEQGKFRKTALDIDLLKYGLEKSNIRKYFNEHYSNIKLVITCMDVIEEYLFTKNGKRCIFGTESEFVKAISDELNIKTIFVSNSPYGDFKSIYINNGPDIKNIKE